MTEGQLITLESLAALVGVQGFPSVSLVWLAATRIEPDRTAELMARERGDQNGAGVRRRSVLRGAFRSLLGVECRVEVAQDLQFVIALGLQRQLVMGNRIV